MIRMKAIKPPKVNRGGYSQELARAVDNTKTDMLRGFRRTTKTWVVKARFDATNTHSLGKFTIDVGTDDPLYAQINEGTSVIYDRLSRNFVPKTRPKVLDSFPGRGGRVGRSTTPQPGIIPRQWDVAMVEFIEPLMISRLQNVLDRFVTASGHELV